MIHGVGTATIRDMDLWSISLTSGLPDQHQQNALQSPKPPQQNGKDDGSKRRRDIPLRDQAPFIDAELPAAMHAHHDSSKQGSHRAGKFTYYFTVGLDAEAAYRCASCLTSTPCCLNDWRCYTNDACLGGQLSSKHDCMLRAGQNIGCNIHVCCKQLLLQMHAHMRGLFEIQRLYTFRCQ